MIVLRRALGLPVGGAIQMTLLLLLHAGDAAQ